MRPARTGAADIHPFVVDFPDRELEDLTDRLIRTRWPDEVSGDGWERGVPVAYLRDLADYWAHSYDWQASVKELNALPNFVTTIDGQRIHFIHVQSDLGDANPLLHGPSST